MYPLNNKTPSMYADIITETSAFLKLEWHQTTLHRDIFENLVLFNQLPGVTPLCRFTRKYNEHNLERQYYTSDCPSTINYLLILNQEGVDTVKRVWMRTLKQFSMIYDTPDTIDLVHLRSRYLSMEKHKIDDIFYGKGKFTIWSIASTHRDTPYLNRRLNEDLHDALEIEYELIKKETILYRHLSKLKRVWADNHP